MYNAIKSQQILQPLSSRASTSSLNPHTPLRNRSLRSPQDRITNIKRGSIRGIQSILGAPNGNSPYSSNSSVDGRASPAPSFATSAHEVRVYLFYYLKIDLIIASAEYPRLGDVLLNTCAWLCLQLVAHDHTRDAGGRRSERAQRRVGGYHDQYHRR